MGKRTFRGMFEVEFEIELDDAVIDAVTPEWKEVLYDLDSTEEIVEMVARNLLKGWSLSEMDGWCDQPNSNAKILDVDWWMDECKEQK